MESPHFGVTPDATPKQAVEEPHTIAGPLCFAGDILAEDIPLPRVEEGDWIVIHGIGGYTPWACGSRHCNRGLPLVLGYSATRRTRGGFACC
jgi:diaminopimelate decarboxylase